MIVVRSSCDVNWSFDDDAGIDDDCDGDVRQKSSSVISRRSKEFLIICLGIFSYQIFDELFLRVRFSEMFT